MSTSSNVMQNQLPLHVSFRKKDPISEVNLKSASILMIRMECIQFHPIKFSIILTISLNFKQTYVYPLEIVHDMYVTSKKKFALLSVCYYKAFVVSINY